MTPKPLAVFTADFPNDFVIEGGRILKMGGHNVAEELRTTINSLGCSTSALVDGGPKGWGFIVDFKGEGFWCHLKSYYPAYYLVFAKPGRRPADAPDSSSAYGELWSALDEALRWDGRFQDLHWYYTFEEAPGPPDGWFGWDLGARKPPGPLARYVARPLGWLSVVLGVVAFLDFVKPAPLIGLAYLLAGGFLLSIGHKISHIFGVRLPWVRLP